MPFARIFMQGKTGNEDETLVLHVHLNPDGSANRNYPYSGWRSALDESWRWPVVFDENGVVDHGWNPHQDEGERYSDMQIYGKPFKTGSKYTMIHRDGKPNTEYTVISVDVDKEERSIK